MKLLLLLLLSLPTTAKEFEANLTDCLYIKYIDTDNDCYFDSLVINDCGNTITENLSTSIMQGKPNKEDFQDANEKILNGIQDKMVLTNV